MPKEWHDRAAVRNMEFPTAETAQLYTNILADKKPYFMIYIYPTLMRQYETYTKNTNKKCIREFRMTLSELLDKTTHTQSEERFIEYYLQKMPVGTSKCVMNKICKKIEDHFDNLLQQCNSETKFDYNILKYEEDYCAAQYNAILALYQDYMKKIQDYMQYVMSERVDADESSSQRGLMVQTFQRECVVACPNRKKLCNIVLDICYKKSCSKQFAWDICGEDIINNLLIKNNHTIYYPVMNDSGDIEFSGKKFILHNKQIGVDLQ